MGAGLQLAALVAFLSTGGADEVPQVKAEVMYDARSSEVRTEVAGLPFDLRAYCGERKYGRECLLGYQKDISNSEKFTAWVGFTRFSNSTWFQGSVQFDTPYINAGAKCTQEAKQKNCELRSVERIAEFSLLQQINFGFNGEIVNPILTLGIEYSPKDQVSTDIFGQNISPYAAVKYVTNSKPVATLGARVNNSVIGFNITIDKQVTAQTTVELPF